MANKAQTSPADVKSEIETLRADFASLAAEVNNLVKAQTEAAKEGAAERVVELKSAGQRELEKVGAAATKSGGRCRTIRQGQPRRFRCRCCGDRFRPWCTSGAEINYGYPSQIDCAARVGPCCRNFRHGRSDHAVACGVALSGCNH